MKNGITQLILGILFPYLMQQDARACTAFQLNDADHVLVGFNLDTLAGDGLIIVNKRGVSKTAMQPIKDVQLKEIGQPAKWTSKYGSITFNQYGRELPFVGMNEAGLIVNTLANPKGEFPAPDSRPSIWSGQWVQYQLDNFATVNEVITSDAQLRIKRTKGLVTGTHYFVTDKDGNCAVIEFINGKRIYYINETMPYNVLTNSTYAESVKLFRRDKIPWIDRGKSIERFIRAVKMVKSYNPAGTKSLLDYSFDMLKRVSWSENRKLGVLKFTMETKWSIVYDVTNLRIYFRTFDNPQIRVINLCAFDFSCATPLKVFDINSSLSGDVTNEFIDYTQIKNRDLIGRAFIKTPYIFLTGLDWKLFWYLIRNGFKRLPMVSVGELDALSRYPDTTVCEMD